MQSIWVSLLSKGKLGRLVTCPWALPKSGREENGK